MLINRDHEAVKPLCEMWGKYSGTNPYLREKRSNDHARTLRGIISDALVPYKGELILSYQRFLSMRPTGAHSFAHGVEMASTTVYWGSVGRIAEAKAEYVHGGTRTMGIPPSQITIGFASQYLVPVTSKVSLRPHYRGHAPYFVLPEEKEGSTPHVLSFDLAVLGQHLFRVQPHKDDWYKVVEIALGDASVEAWLTAHDSAEVIPVLRNL